MPDDVAVVFDCGSTNAAVVAVDCQGQIVESARHPNAPVVPLDPEGEGWRTWDLEQVWGKLADACRHLEDLEWEEYSLRELAVRGVNPRRNLVLLARFYNENGQLAAALQVLQLLRFPNRSGRNHLPPEKFAPLGTK